MADSNIIYSQLGSLSDVSFSFIFSGVKIAEKCELSTQLCNFYRRNRPLRRKLQIFQLVNDKIKTISK